jgi:hypothetical protein
MMIMIMMIMSSIMIIMMIMIMIMMMMMVDHYDAQTSPHILIDRSRRNDRVTSTLQPRPQIDLTTYWYPCANGQITGHNYAYHDALQPTPRMDPRDPVNLLQCSKAGQVCVNATNVSDVRHSSIVCEFWQNCRELTDISRRCELGCSCLLHSAVYEPGQNCRELTDILRRLRRLTLGGCLCMKSRKNCSRGA